MWEFSRAEFHFFLWVIISSCRNYRCHRRFPHHFTPLFHRHTCSAPDASSGLFSLGKKLCCLTVCINRGLFLWSFKHISFQISHWHWKILQFFSALTVHLGSNSNNSSSRSFQEIYNFKRWLLKVCLNAYDQTHQLKLLGHHILEISTKPFNAH